MTIRIRSSRKACRTSRSRATARSLVQAPLVELVEHDRADALQRRVGQQLPGQDPLGRHPEPGPRPDLPLEADEVADLLAERPAPLVGDPGRGRPRRDPTGLEDDDRRMLAPEHARLEQGRRHPGRLAGARLGDEDERPMAADRLDDLGQPSGRSAAGSCGRRRGSIGQRSATPADSRVATRCPQAVVVRLELQRPADASSARSGSGRAAGSSWPRPPRAPMWYGFSSSARGSRRRSRRSGRGRTRRSPADCTPRRIAGRGRSARSPADRRPPARPRPIRMETSGAARCSRASRPGTRRDQSDRLARSRTSGSSSARAEASVGVRVDRCRRGRAPRRPPRRARTSSAWTRRRRVASAYRASTRARKASGSPSPRYCS